MEKERDLDVKMLVRFRDKFKEALQAKTGWGCVELEKLVDDTMFDTILDTPDEELLQREPRRK